MAGKLFLCATPIGNLEDITFRVLETLKNADLIAAEDTRGSIKLLNHFDIHVPMTSYHEYNKYDKAKYLIRQMQEGKNIALVTDAGTPGISDPGEELVRMCLDEGIEVTSLPGACACITALTMSGLPTRRFCFEGFLPADKKDQQKVLNRLKTETRTCMLYEAPHRLLKTLSLLEKNLDGGRRISVLRELTKRHETLWRGTIGSAVSYYTENPPKGEIVLVIEGASETQMELEKQQSWDQVPLKDHVNMYIAQGMTKKDAMKAAAKDRGLSRRDIYNALIEEESEEV